MNLRCEMLNWRGKWDKVLLLKSDFRFIANYCCPAKNHIQIWRGKNKDYFVLRNIKEVLK